MEGKTVFEFRYTDFLNESAMATISIHATKEGAQKALDHHKAQEHKQWIEHHPGVGSKKDFPFGQMELWDVQETKVLN